MIRSPAHRSFPSGHATEAFAAAAILSATFPAYTAHLRQMAARIAMNRCFAGVHYPVDQYAGDLLGDLLGGLVVHKVFGKTSFKAAGQAETFTTGGGPRHDGRALCPGLAAACGSRRTDGQCRD